MEQDLILRIKECKASIIIAFNKVFIKLSDAQILFNVSKKYVSENISPFIPIGEKLHIKNNYWCSLSILLSLFDDKVPFSEIGILKWYCYIYESAKVQNENLVALYLALDIRFREYYDPLPLVMKNDEKINSQLFPLINSIKVFNFLIDLQSTSYREQFLLYWNFVKDHKDESFIFSTSSLNSFINKLNQFKEHGYLALIHKGFSNNNAAIDFDKREIEIIKNGYRDGIRRSFRTITKNLNTDRILRGRRKVSIQTVINFTKKSGDYGLLALQRNGSQAIDNLLVHPDRKQPNNPGTQYQIDGSRLNVPYINSDGKPDFLQLVVLLDVFSKKIVGYTLTETETFGSYFKVISQVITETKHLPAELLSDNLPSLNGVDCQRFIEKIKKLGVLVRRHVPLNPSDKGSVEVWFRIFGRMYLKEKKGYLGDGIKSKDTDGKPNSDLIEDYKKKKNIRSRSELETFLHQQIIEYNSTYVFKNSTPNLLFANNKMINGIKVLDADLYRYIIFKEKFISLKKAGINIQYEKKTYQYLLYAEHIKILLKYFEKELIVRYDPKNMEKVFVYTIDSFFSICELELHVNFPLAQIEQSEKDKIAIKQFGAKRYQFKKKLLKLSKDYLNNENEIISSPMELISEKYDSKNLVAGAVRNYHFPPKKQNIDVIKISNASENNAFSEEVPDYMASIERMFHIKGNYKLIK